jgi:hypothetical protein
MLDLNEETMGQVRFGPLDLLSSPGVEFPDQDGIGAECFRGGEFFRPVISPKTFRTSKCRYPTLSRDTGSG